MLVLSRKESERIRLGDSITVTVVRVAGDKVRLGIDAPPHILVLREELDSNPRGAVAASDRLTGKLPANGSATVSSDGATHVIELSVQAD